MKTLLSVFCICLSAVVLLYPEKPLHLKVEPPTVIYTTVPRVQYVDRVQYVNNLDRKPECLTFPGKVNLTVAEAQSHWFSRDNQLCYDPQFLHHK